MGALADYLQPRLKERFPERLTLLDGDAPFAEFAPVWEGFGALALYDHGDEITIYFGCFTHVHCTSYDEKLSQSEKLAATADLVLTELELVFSDRWLMR